TSAGTPSSTACITVHRPSPESATTPSKLDKVGFSARACAVRSSSHELITLPRRHTSVMSARSRSYRRSGSRSLLAAFLKMSRPSAYDCMRPYSIPLCTIFTKWPAPVGPQWSQPCSSGVCSPERPGVRGARGVELLHELLEGLRCRLDIRVVRLQVVAGRAQALGHVGAHPSQPDHSELHQICSAWIRATRRPRALSDSKSPSACARISR